jgi:regulator of sigma D
MGLFSKLVGGSDNQKTGTAKGERPLTAAPEKISYDADLVNRLKGEHQELVQVFTSIKSVATEGHFRELPALMEHFKLTFLNHVALENVKFYVYMQKHLALDEETLSFITGVRKEMNGIARSVVRFIDTHLAVLPSPATVADFNSELDQIGDVLVRRVQMEENRLYTLYQP